MDNGPEFVAKLAQNWNQAKRNRVHIYTAGETDPERTDRKVQQQVLDAYIFDSLDEVRDITAEWMLGYNNHRTHDSLGRLSPRVYRNKI